VFILDENPHNAVIPAVGADDNNPDDISAGELQGAYKGIPVGISTFKGYHQIA